MGSVCRAALRGGEPGRAFIAQLARGGVVGLPQKFSVQCTAGPGWRTAAPRAQVKQMDSRTFSCICFKSAADFQFHDTKPWDGSAGGKSALLAVQCLQVCAVVR